MQNPEIPSTMRRMASELFEAQMLKSALCHLRCTSADLDALIQAHTNTIAQAVRRLACVELVDRGMFTTWACHSCGGDDRADCHHCEGAGHMTVDDIVEMVVV